MLLLLALALRSVGPDWDGGIAAHPDERYLLGAAQGTPLWGNVCRTHPQFPYGHLPVTVGQLIAAAAPEADPLYAARLLSALVGIILVVLAGACARAIAGPRAGLLAATLAAVSPGLIQQSHFFTVDPWGAAFACAGVLAATRGRWRSAGAFTGLAIACKASLAMGAVPLLVLAVVAPRARPGRRGRLRGMLLWRGFRYVGPLVVAFGLAAPWAVLTPKACWEGPWLQSLVISGRFPVPYTQQYAGTLPVLYPLTQMALWGLGPGVVGLGLVGLAMLCLRPHQTMGAYVAPPWLWCLWLLFVIGSLPVKFPRYLLPLYPWWIAWAVSTVIQDGPPPSGLWLRRLGTAFLLVTTGLLGLAQVAIYASPHPWLTASGWMYEHLPAGATIAVEAWDHPLPVPMAEGDPAAFTQIVVPIYETESAGKREARAAGSAAQIVALATRRGYGTLSRQSDVYVDTLTWYADLLTDRTVLAFSRCPRLGPLAVTDDPLADAGLPTSLTLAERCGAPLALRLPRLDESFRVYDAPQTLVLTVDDG